METKSRVRGLRVGKGEWKEAQSGVGRLGGWAMSLGKRSKVDGLVDGTRCGGSEVESCRARGWDET